MRGAQRRFAAGAFLGFAALVAACGSGAGSSSTSPTTAVAPPSAAAGPYLDGGFPATESPIRGGTLRAAMQSDIDCWNGLSYYGVSWTLFAFMARGLYGYPNTVAAPATDTMQPELAADMPAVSADGRSYTVTLRDGLTFPDGSPVTARDVKATFERMLDPTLQCASGGPPASGYFAGLVGAQEYMDRMAASDVGDDVGIPGIEVVDERTTTFTLVEPDASFPRALAMSWAFIVPAAARRDAAPGPPPFVGPYRIARLLPGALVEIERQPGWERNVAAGVPQAAGENNIDGIAVQIGLPASVQYDGIAANRIDVSLDGSAPAGPLVAAAASTPAYRDRLFSTPAATVDYAVLRADRPPFDDVRLRQAINHALDRSAVAAVAGGVLRASPWSQILPANLLIDQPTVVYRHEPVKARALIAAAGARRPIAITLAHADEPLAARVVVAMRRSLEAVGFRVAIVARPSRSYYRYLADPAADYDIALARWSQDHADAMTFYGPLLLCGSGANNGRFCDEGLDATIGDIDRLPLGHDRSAQLAQVSTATARDLAPWAPLTLERMVSFVSARLGNFVWGPAKQFYFAAYFLRDGA